MNDQKPWWYEKHVECPKCGQEAIFQLDQQVQEWQPPNAPRVAARTCFCGRLISITEKVKRERYVYYALETDGWTAEKGNLWRVIQVRVSDDGDKTTVARGPIRTGSSFEEACNVAARYHEKAVEST